MQESNREEGDIRGETSYVWTQNKPVVHSDSKIGLRFEISQESDPNPPPVTLFQLWQSMERSTHSALFVDDLSPREFLGNPSDFS